MFLFPIAFLSLLTEAPVLSSSSQMNGPVSFPSPQATVLPTITEDPAPASHSGFSRGLLQILIDPSKTIGAQLMANLLAVP